MIRPIKQRPKYEDDLFNLRPGSIVHVRATEWQEYMSTYSGMPVINGRVYRMKGKDAAGGMVMVKLIPV